MSEETNQMKSFLSAASVVTLAVGLASVAASIFIFYASRDRPAMTIDQLPAISYASPATLSSLGQVTLTVNGTEIGNLHGIPFRARNSGNRPISSLQGSKAFNLTGPVVLQVSAPIKGQILAVETVPGDLSLNTSSKRESGKDIILLGIQNINPGGTADFTVMYAGDSEPEFALLGNPLVGGSIALLKNSLPVRPSTTWEKFKGIWLAQGLGFLFLAQIPIVLIILAIGTRLKWLEEQRADSDNPQKEQAKKEQKEQIAADIDERVKAIDPTVVETMQSASISIPASPFGEGEASMSLFNIFRESFKSKWEWELTDKYPLPKEFDLFPNINRRVVTSWLGWGDFCTNFLIPLVVVSSVLGFLGYALVFW